MEFFNSKEEVLELVLTQKGRELLSSGKFKPTHYSFYDGDITYESKNLEEQNEIVPRIKSAPRLKQPTNVYQNSTNSSTVLQTQKIYCELGNKMLADQYKPAWELNFIQSPPFQYIGDRNTPTDSKKYQIKLSSSFDNNNSNQDSIPQIDMQSIYSIVKIKDSSNYYLIKDNPIILDVSEFNSFDSFEKQEYTIEAFYIKDSKLIEPLSFNKDSNINIFDYINVLFDKEASFEEKLNIKNIYGDMVEKDKSKC